MNKKLNLHAVQVKSFVTRLNPRDVRAGAAGETLDEVPCTFDTMPRDCNVVMVQQAR
jgi:hypothetical protein